MGSPTEIIVRWEATDKQYYDDTGNLKNLDAYVVLDQDVAIGDHLWLGSLSEWTGTGVGLVDNEMMEVVVFKSTPDIDGIEYRKTAGLVYFRSTNHEGQT